jgi:AbrB family looped-hinge helix DNA binding protein
MSVRITWDDQKHDLKLDRRLDARGRSTPGLVRCYLTHMRTTISTKGQIVLPAELRAADGIEAGEEFEVDRVGPDEYRLTRLTPPPNRGLVEWLRSCPDEGWFVEIESESTDSL